MWRRENSPNSAVDRQVEVIKERLVEMFEAEAAQPITHNSYYMSTQTKVGCISAGAPGWNGTCRSEWMALWMFVLFEKGRGGGQKEW